MRPTPHGVGGLKFVGGRGTGKTYGSHPSRGGWIEIHKSDGTLYATFRPTPHGVGGLKSHHALCAIVNGQVPPLTGWVD